MVLQTRQLTPREAMQATMRDWLELLEGLPSEAQREILDALETYIRERRSNLPPNG